jgi:hypothetical protein
VPKMMELKCTQCPSITMMQEDSYRRYCQRNNRTDYICQRCTNQRISSSRTISQEERVARSLRAKKQWMDEEIRKKMIDGLRRQS